MRLLLDTHIFLWWTMQSKALSKAAETLIQEATAVYVSSASLWEITIKKMLNKIEVDLPSLGKAIEASGFLPLPITARHAIQVGELPPIHRDPFDRLLIAQALIEPLKFLTADKSLLPYAPELIEVI